MFKPPKFKRAFPDDKCLALSPMHQDSLEPCHSCHLFILGSTQQRAKRLLCLLLRLREGSCLASWKVYLCVVSERIVVLQVRIRICFYTTEHYRNQSTAKERQVDQDDSCNMVCRVKTDGAKGWCSPMWEDYINRCICMTENYVIINMSQRNDRKWKISGC